ncbi:MAG: hypothetical protein U9R56_06330 [candidate division Zixibacteria bacterium]|nr:hypothetical protein [candidate division Zixibacteria bacterium]
MRLNRAEIFRMLSALLLVAVTLSNCNTNPSKSELPDNMYRLDGILVSDMNLYSCRAEIDFQRNDSGFANALIGFGGESFSYVDDIYRLGSMPAIDFPTGVYDLEIEDPLGYTDSITTTVADTFSIELTDLTDRLNPGGALVPIIWTGSADADGYIITAVRRYMAYSGQGFSSWASKEARNGSIPPEAFRWTAGNNLDTGWYYVHVCAYTGKPDSVLSADLLPVPLPNQPEDNIQRETLNGRFGTVVVALRDSIYVATQ